MGLAGGTWVVDTDAVGEKLKDGALSSESVLEVDC